MRRQNPTLDEPFVESFESSMPCANAFREFCEILEISLSKRSTWGIIWLTFQEGMRYREFNSRELEKKNAREQFGKEVEGS